VNGQSKPKSAHLGVRRVSIALTAAAVVLAGVLPQAQAASKPNPHSTTRGSAADASTTPRAGSAALRNTRDAVATRMTSYVARHGTRYTFATYVDAKLGKVVLNSDAPDAVITGITGADKSAVVVHHEKVQGTFSRKSDTPPFWGGAGIATPVGICSAGYTVQNSAGTRYMVTAGHCGSNGGAVTTENGGLAFGTISGNGGPSRDMELIGGQSYAGRIYGGGVDSTVSYPVVGAGDPVVGFNNYCHSGRTTGENCGHTAVSVTGSVCTSFGCQSPVIVFTGGVQPQPGDSGDPFFVGAADPSSSNKWIRGHVFAISGTTTGYAELYSRVASFYGVTVVTG